MPKYLLSLSFAFLILILSVSPASAQEYTEEITPEPTVAMQEAKPTTPSAIVKYDLAYPGILPDSPIYKLKVLRDKITVGLISNPQKKAEFYLLQADKGILAAAMLVDKKDFALAKETALKAEHNITMMTYDLWRFPKRLNLDFYNKLKTASLKHQEVLVSLMKRVPEEDGKVFQTVLDFSKRNWETIEQFQTSPNIVH